MITDFFQTERAGFAGDWHGNTGWALSAIDFFHEQGIRTIYHVGDFGVWGGTDGAAYLRKINTRLLKHDMLILVTPGNHENYNMINKWPRNIYGFQNRKDLDRLWVIPRGQAWKHNGALLASMGGAASIDKGMRRLNKSWWPQEAISDKDIYNLKVNLWGRPVHVLLTHDIPAEVDVGPRYGMLPVDIEKYSQDQREQLSKAAAIARPEVIIHGHWHRSYSRMTKFDYGQTMVHCLDMDGSPHNIAVANLSLIHI